MSRAWPPSGHGPPRLSRAGPLGDPALPYLDSRGGLCPSSPCEGRRSILAAGGSGPQAAHRVRRRVRSLCTGTCSRRTWVSSRDSSARARSRYDVRSADCGAQTPRDPRALVAEASDTVDFLHGLERDPPPASRGLSMDPAAVAADLRLKRRRFKTVPDELEAAEAGGPDAGITLRLPHRGPHARCLGADDESVRGVVGAPVVDAIAEPHTACECKMEESRGDEQWRCTSMAVLA